MVYQHNKQTNKQRTHFCIKLLKEEKKKGLSSQGTYHIKGDENGIN